MSTSTTPVAERENEDHAHKRVGFMLGQYAKARPHEPVIYTASIAAILAEYPREVVDYVTDPRTGMASRLKWIPEPAEVKEACEEQMRPIRIEQGRKAREEANRRSLPPPIDRSKRPTVEEIKADLAKRGFVMGERGRVVAIETPDMVKAKLGITNEQWNAIPDLPESMRNRG